MQEDKLGDSITYKDIQATLNFINTRLLECQNILALHQKAKVAYVEALKKEIISDVAGLNFE